MKRFALMIGVLVFALPSLSRAAAFDLHETTGFPNTLRGRDFFIYRSDTHAADTHAADTHAADTHAADTHAADTHAADIHAADIRRATESCRDNIAKVICRVDPAQKDQDIMTRVCLTGGEKYAEPFERLYDNYPPALQKMFCSLKRIFIEREFFGTAYAGLIKRGGEKQEGAMIGIRQSVLDENLALGAWASWKEQLSFGGPTDAYKPRPDLPIIQAKAHAKANDFLYFVIAHEFGHLFDFANDLNKTRNCRKDSGDDETCEMTEDSWGGISWLTNKSPKPENEFDLRSSLCFYWCNGLPLPATAVPAVYEGLNKTSFISLYATTQPWDDFADTLAYDLSFRKIGLRYKIETVPGGAVYDIGDKLRSPLFAAKFAYIRKFLTRQDIVYP